MLVVRPAWNNPIFYEWRRWQRKLNSSKNFVEYDLAWQAKRSIESIAEDLYPDGCVVGFMIMEEDEFQDSKFFEAGFPHLGDSR